MRAEQFLRGLQYVVDGDAEAYQLGILRDAYAFGRITFDELEALTESTLRRYCVRPDSQIESSALRTKGGCG